MQTASPPLDLTLYRANVGVVLFDRAGRVWLGRRAKTKGPYNWQFPQGGVDEGEDLQNAALRELHEETGVVTVTLLDRTQDWMTYDFPPGWTGSKAQKGWRGQKQVWFAFRFEGDDSEIDLNAHLPAEFDAWRWGRLEDAPDRIVPFKRDTYLQVAQAFARFAAPPERPRGGWLSRWFGG